MDYPYALTATLAGLMTFSLLYVSKVLEIEISLFASGYTLSPLLSAVFGLVTAYSVYVGARRRDLSKVIR